MLRSALCYIYLLLSLIFTIPHLWRVRRMEKKSPTEEYAKAVHRVASGWARSLVRVSGARMHVVGAENIPEDRAVLFVSNHQSDFDIVVFLACVSQPIGFVAKIEMLKVPILRAWMRRMRCVFMDRKDIRQSAKVILDAIGILKSGHSMVVFPEGTRSISDEPLPFKPGSFKLATKSKACVVPVTVSGSYKIMEGNNYRIQPADVYVTFHPPVFTDSLSTEELSTMPQQVEETIKECLRGYASRS